MKTRQPLLTISLLSSGRTKTIRQCLDSIVPLMQKVDSELIIVDTGCDEEVNALMSEYTDQIIPFTWCDDFSKARNAGLERANGEWFLYLDDDEWFLDTKEIEDFFLSGEYQHYFYGCYIVRNYFSYDRQTYNDTWVSRLVRLENGVRFVSSIHEYFSPLQEPHKLLHSIAEHFGYAYKTEEERRKRTRRNVSLLLQMLQKEKDNIRWWIQLIQEYISEEEYLEVQELCNEGLTYFKEQDIPNINRHRGAFYCGLVEVALRSGDYEQAAWRAEAFLKDHRNTQMCQMYLYAQCEEARFQLKKYKAAITCAEKYIEYYELLKDKETERQSQETLFVKQTFDSICHNNVLSGYILSALQYDDTSVLKQYFHEFEWNEKMVLYSGLVGELIKAMSRLPYDEAFVSMAAAMAGQRALDVVWDTSREIEKTARENPTDENRERFYRIARIFSQLDAPNHYVWYLKIIDSVHNGQPADLEKCYQKLFHYVADIFQLEDEVFTIALEQHIHIPALFEQIPFDQWRIGVDSFFEGSSVEKIAQRAAFVKDTMPDTEQPGSSVHTGGISRRLAMRYDYFFLKEAEAQLVYYEAAAFSDETEAFAVLRQRMNGFAERSLAFYGQFYQAAAFEGEMALLPPSCRAAVKLQALLQAQTGGDRQQIGNCLKAAVGVFRKLDAALKTYAILAKAAL